MIRVIRVYVSVTVWALYWWIHINPHLCFVVYNSLISAAPRHTLFIDVQAILVVVAIVVVAILTTRTPVLVRPRIIPGNVLYSVVLKEVGDLVNGQTSPVRFKKL